MDEYLEATVSNVIDCLTQAANSDYIGESVSQLEHALQCAYFAECAGHSKEVVLACLLHDMGHFASQTKQSNMDNLGVVYHEWIGAKLAYDLGFCAKICLLIGYHVEAKRYLAAKKKSYFERLSSASKGTLNFQGGAMSPEEMKFFEVHPLFKEILQVRVNDEKAKVTNLSVPDLNYYRNHFKTYFRDTNEERMLVLSIPNHVNTLWVKELKAFLEREYSLTKS